jgi:hypothetical protein
MGGQSGDSVVGQMNDFFSHFCVSSEFYGSRLALYRLLYPLVFLIRPPKCGAKISFFRGIKLRVLCDNPSSREPESRGATQRLR